MNRSWVRLPQAANQPREVIPLGALGSACPQPLGVPSGTFGGPQWSFLARVLGMTAWPKSFAVEQQKCRSDRGGFSWLDVMFLRVRVVALGHCLSG